MSTSRRRFRFSLRLKLVATTVLLAGLVVFTFGVLVLKLTSDDLDDHTETLAHVRSSSLHESGLSTARTLSAAALSPFLERNRASLFALVEPIVDAKGDIDVLYAYLVDTGAETPDDDRDDGQLWIAVAEPGVASLGGLEVSAPSGDAIFFPNASDRLGDWRDATAQGDTPKRKQRLSAAPFEGGLRVEPRVFERQRTLRGEGETRSVQVKEYITAVVQPATEEGGATAVAYLVIGYSLGQIQHEVEGIRSEGQAQQSELRIRVLFIGGLAIALGVLVAIFQSLGITLGLRTLSSVARRLADGELNIRARVRSSDEIGELGATFNMMAERIRQLLRDTRDKAVLEKELDIARSIQETLLPDPGLKHLGPLSLCGFFRPASICGGDFWHHDRLDETHTLICIGDVTGHGVPSAMISAAAKSGLDTLRNMSGADLDPETIVRELNKTIFDTAQRKFVMTFLAMNIDTENQCVQLASAGHNFPLLLRPSAEDPSRYQARPLVARGPRLGDLRESTYTPHDAALLPGDVLFLYTDGLTEFRDASGAEYGDRRLRRLLTRDAHLPPDRLLERVLEDLSAFSGDSPQEDDITIVIAKYEGP